LRRIKQPDFLERVREGDFWQMMYGKLLNFVPGGRWGASIVLGIALFANKRSHRSCSAMRTMGRRDISFADGTKGGGHMSVGWTWPDKPN